MDLVWSVLLFCLGIGLLVKGADWLVDSAARIARQFGVSNFIIGLTIVALGTSLPELATAVTASFARNSVIVLGNVIGSNIANLALVLGLAGVFVPIVVKKDIYNRDGLIMLLATLLFYGVCLDGVVSALEGGFFVFAFIAYIGYFIVEKKPYKAAFHFRRYLGEYSDMKKKERFDSGSSFSAGFRSLKGLAESPFLLLGQFGVLAKRFGAYVEKARKDIGRERQAILFLLKQLAISFFGAGCIFFGASFVVETAAEFPLDPMVFSLIFIAVGTSLPELSVTISSLRKGIPEIMIGNLIGSNIANILLIGGVSALISPLVVASSVLVVDFIFLIVVTWLFLVFLRNDYKFEAIESLTLVLLYVLFIAVVLGLMAAPG